MTGRKLEALLRHYPEFRALYEREGIEEITIEGGLVVNVHDVLRGIPELPRRQRQAVILMCLYNLREVDAARIMGMVKWTSPVSSYKRLGLEKLCQRHWNVEEETV